MELWWFDRFAPEFGEECLAVSQEGLLKKK
jgi:hypothetical protein